MARVSWRIFDDSRNEYILPLLRMNRAPIRWFDQLDDGQVPSQPCLQREFDIRTIPSAIHLKFSFIINRLWD